jgi:hypothetical protein
MSKMRSPAAALIVSLMLLTELSWAAPGSRSAVDIHRRMVSAYLKASSYDDKGVIVLDAGKTGFDSWVFRAVQYVRFRQVHPTFETRFLRTGRKHFEFRRPEGARYVVQRDGPGPATASERATSSDSSSWLSGLRPLTGVTAGTSLFVPGLLAGDASADSLASLSNLRLHHPVKVRGSDCWVISGVTQRYAIKLWISQRDFHLVRLERQGRKAGLLTTVAEFEDVVLRP